MAASENGEGLCPGCHGSQQPSNPAYGLKQPMNPPLDASLEAFTILLLILRGDAQCSAESGTRLVRMSEATTNMIL